MKVSTIYLYDKGETRAAVVWNMGVMRAVVFDEDVVFTIILTDEYHNEPMVSRLRCVDNMKQNTRIDVFNDMVCDCVWQDPCHGKTPDTPLFTLSKKERKDLDDLVEKWSDRLYDKIHDNKLSMNTVIELESDAHAVITSDGITLCADTDDGPVLYNSHFNISAVHMLYRNLLTGLMLNDPVNEFVIPVLSWRREHKMKKVMKLFDRLQPSSCFDSITL